MSEFQILTVRKLANMEGQERVRKFDAETGQPKLVNPATPGEDHEPWPLLGVTIQGDPPERTSAGVSWVNAAIAEGWLERLGEEIVNRPGGPLRSPWAVIHTFVHATGLVLYDYERGPVYYEVTRQPDKYDASGNPISEYADDTDLRDAEVSWVYELSLRKPAVNQVGVGGKDGRRG